MPAPTPNGRRITLRRVVTSVWFRVAFTLGLLAIIAAQLDWGQMARRIQGGQPLDFAAAVGLVLMALVIGAYRWAVLLHRAGVPLQTSRLARIYAVSTFSNTFLPTTVGGDVTRAVLVAQRGPVLRRAALTILVDRVGGLLGLVVLAWGALAVEPASVPSGATTFLAAVTASLAAGTAAVLLVARRQGPTRLRALVPERLWGAAVDVRAVIADLGRAPATLTIVLVTSIAFQALVAAQLVLLARAIDVELPFSTAAVSLALVTVVTLLPVSVGGFGLREGSYVVLLGGASISASDATLISVLTVAALLFASLPGAYLLARGDLGVAAGPVTS